MKPLKYLLRSNNNKYSKYKNIYIYILTLYTYVIDYNNKGFNIAVV